MGLHCANCGTLLEAKFCPACGQSIAAGARLTWRTLLATCAHTFDLDRGILHTVRDLTFRPGAMIRDYLDGHRVGYVNPLKYLLLMVSLALVTLIWLAPAPPSTAPPEAARVQQLVHEWGNAMLIVTVPFFAAGTWWFYRNAERTYPEHLALNAFVLGHQNLLSLVVPPLSQLGPRFAQWTALLYLVACAIYFGIALRGSVARTWLGALVGAFVLCVIIYTAHMVGLGVWATLAQ